MKKVGPLSPYLSLSGQKISDFSPVNLSNHCIVAYTSPKAMNSCNLGPSIQNSEQNAFSLDKLVDLVIWYSNRKLTAVKITILPPSV